ncbi:ABC transporter C family member 13 [Impatiens glandulifera]|uniref:ABC transporter C family member 13 n=1 Tax=Impatiens glandulifera TaxID=253017 RepID=UPI001FB15BB8|nr:ABC transporter C family member 13 [Impatiens glandulifera]
MAAMVQADIPNGGMKMILLSFVCPESPYVWNDNGFSTCFISIVLGCGVNILTLIILSVLAKWTSRQSGLVYSKERVLLFLLPAIGASMGLLHIALLLKESLKGHTSVFHEWLLGSCQFLTWIIILLIMKWDCQFSIICNRIWCFWWIMKPFLGIPLLQLAFSSGEVLRFLKESFGFLVDVSFGLTVNIIRIKQSSRRYRKDGSMHEPFIPRDTDIEEGHKEIASAQRFWHRFTFKPITSVMERGMVKQLDLEDLVQLPNDIEPSVCLDMLLSCWQKGQSQQRNFSHPSLFRAICGAYGWPYLRLGVLKAVNDGIGFVGPLLLNSLIRFLQKGSPGYSGYVFAILLGLTSVAKSFLDTQYTFLLAKLKLKLRSSIMTTIYHKCLNVSLAERSKFSEGEIQTFMSVDSDRTVNLCNSFHDMWSLPLQIGIALYLLYTQVKFAFLSGITITIFLIPVNKWIANLISNATKKMMEQKDERIRRTGELLMNIRTLKMYGWELLFTSWLKETRSSEVTHLSTRKYLDAWCVFFWATTPTLFSLSTFGLYSLMGYQLDAATVFTCLALINNLISPLNSFPWVINGLIDAVISIKRLNRFISCPEQQMEHYGNSSTFSSKDELGSMAVDIHGACGSWSSIEEKGGSGFFNHLTLAIPKGSLVTVIGEVGSGKSSLLNLILGELRLFEGLVHSEGSIAYVPQVPWILSGTIRDNILFGKEYDPRRYYDVLQACALNVDISQMVGGDTAYVGEKGFNLSGGQKVRLALARAIYHGADIFLLDDVLSAVDAQVARLILHKAMLSPLMKHHTRILCTHNMQAIVSADVIVVMDKGHIKWLGSSAELSACHYMDFSSKHILFSQDNIEDRNPDLSVADQQAVTPESGEAVEITEVESRKEGRVEPAIYKHYAAFCGWFITIATCFSAVLMQGSRNGNDLWLSYWVDTTAGSQSEYPMAFYLGILAVFCLINSSLTLARAFLFAYGGLCAAIRVHNELLAKLVNAPISFFDQTPTGRILNRFSSDLYTVDDALPFILNILLATFVSLLGIAIVLSYVQVVFLLLLFPLWYIYSNLQFYYRSTSRELRRLDSVSRSPIYASFTETLCGSSTIRAFKSEDFFMNRFIKHMTLYQRTSYSETLASLWLSLRLQLLGAFVIFFVAVMAVIGSREYLPINLGTPGLVGLALSYAAPLVSLLGSFLSSFTETEKEMVSVERVVQYMDICQEELDGFSKLEPGWPSEGQIEFQNVTLRYMPSLPAALHHISFTIAGGTQVGIVGRTGAGKSSVLNALFRLNPLSHGCILVDSKNIYDIPVRDLRSHLAVVPQNPFLFEGSLRANLDPFSLNDDSTIWNTLEKCQVKEDVQAAGGLEILVKECGNSFSVGQRQLLCLARALLKCSKVLCLDECTANVDAQTASKLQTAITGQCRGITVVTIAHRISTVMGMDDILVVDSGMLVEQGNPRVLVQDPLSRFSSFAKASSM